MASGSRSILAPTTRSRYPLARNRLIAPVRPGRRAVSARPAASLSSSGLSLSRNESVIAKGKRMKTVPVEYGFDEVLRNARPSQLGPYERPNDRPESVHIAA